MYHRFQRSVQVRTKATATASVRRQRQASRPVTLRPDGRCPHCGLLGATAGWTGTVRVYCPRCD